ncbi:MAG: xanthine dehydrogenase family protein subunit M [Candidatus Delongbacteria bacterium]|nr:xanthine dehydrogenase family protein subunit M [Candidatus Delongbacteria bacterium]
MKSIELLSPATTDELDELLARYPGTPLLAGATDLMPLLRRGVLHPARMIGLHSLRDELGKVEDQGEGLVIGSMSDMALLASHPTIRQRYPLLAEAAGLIGAPQIQQMATLGGNIANASPAADSVPPLLVYDASLILQSSAGTREIPLSEFYLGYKQLALAPTEWIRAVQLPLAPVARGFYSKTGARRAQAIAKLSLAVLIGTSGSGIFRVAAGALSPFPCRLPGVEDYVRQLLQEDTPLPENELRRHLAGDLAPIDDMRSTAAYRLRVAQNILCNIMREVGIELA